jgi:thiosulfate reductase cytochrome b subunit
MRERDVMRWVHLIGSAAIGTFVYSPWRNQAGFLLSMRVLVIPILILTGLWMWQGHRMKKFLSSSQQKPEDL